MSLLLLLYVVGIISIAGATYFFCCHKKMGATTSGIVSFFVGLVCAGILLYATRSAAPQAESDVIIVGASGDFPPFAYIENGQLAGLDIELIEEIGNRLHKKIELKNMPFTTLLPSLQLGNIDVIICGVSETPERAQQVLFTTPYVDNNPLVIVSLSAFPAKTIEDLYGKEVVVNTGYVADLYMSNIKGPLLKRLTSPAEAFLALKTGRAFAFVAAQNTISPFFAQHDSQQFHVEVIQGTNDSASIAIAPQHATLREEIQEALDSMKKDGSLQQLKNKWGL